MIVILAIRVERSLKTLKESKRVMGTNKGLSGMADSNLSNEINKRRTFAIIYRPNKAL